MGMRARATGAFLARAAACSLGAFGLVACGGTQAVRATAPLSPAQAALFTDGVDMLEDPDALQDRWRSDWLQEAQGLATESQLIVRGTVAAVRSDQDPDQRTSYQLVLHVDKVLLGNLSDSELVLISRQGAAGYATVAEQKERLLRASVLAFVRYAVDEGVTVAHFQVKRPSAPALEAVDRRLGKDSAHRVEIVEHVQE